MALQPGRTSNELPVLRRYLNVTTINLDHGKTKIFLFIVIVTIQSCQTANQKEDNNDNFLIGSWKFIADQELDNKNQVKNEDINVRGLLIYTVDRKMSVQLLWLGSRTSLVNDTIMNQDGKSFGIGLGNNSWTLEQSRKIIDTYDAYFGDYSVDWKNKIITHAISGNLRPEKEATSYKRAFQINGDTLFLRSADPDPNMKWQTKWIRSNR